MTVLTILCLILLGMVAGLSIGFLVFRHKNLGTIQIDHSDPSEPPYLFVRLNQTVDYLSKQKKASFKIKVENFIPHN